MHRVNARVKKVRRHSNARANTLSGITFTPTIGASS